MSRRLPRPDFRLFWLCALVFALAPLGAQTFHPLEGYDELLPPANGKRTSPRSKVVCEELDLSAFTVIRPGERIEQVVRPDTFMLETPVTYSCGNCGAVNGGSAIPRGDTLIYEATEAIEERADTIMIRACGADGECNDPTPIFILVQREAAQQELPARNVAPGEEITVEIPDDPFARKAACRAIEACAPDYPGRERAFFFDSFQRDGNDFTYVAARYGGTDAICVRLCTEFGLCDTYRTEITVDRPTRGLPFLDDFSAPGFRPLADLWQDEDVLINRTLAQLPVSVGVATFDAVDSDGGPYPAVGGGRRTAVRDYLTSTPLELAGQNGAALSFYVQPRGLGNRPEVQDSFLVEFLAPGGQWRLMLAVPGQPTTEGFDTLYPFTPYNIPLADEFLYDGFSFRFSNKSGESGAVDMWHLDYVKLDRTSNTATTNDVAIIGEPGPILGPFTSIPLRHFQAGPDDLAQPSVSFGIFNLGDEASPLSSDKPSTIAVFGKDRISIANESVTKESTFGLVGNVLPQVHEVGELSLGWDGLARVTGYLKDLPDDGEPVELTTVYEILTDREDFQLSPVIDDNNEVSSTTVLDEYMALDDGSAEGFIEVPEETSLLQRYTAYVEDELKGIQLRIPRSLGSYDDQPIQLVVYAGDTLPTDLLYEASFPVVLPEDVADDSLGGFTTYIFDEPVPLAVGSFFVGFRQTRAPRNIGIGFDRNINSEDRQLFGAPGNWQILRFGRVTGTLMFRPLLEGYDGFTTSTDDASEAAAAGKLVEVYPNPTSGPLNLRLRAGVSQERLELRLYGSTGALLRYGRAQDRMDLTGLPAGFYTLEASDGRRRSYHKVIRQ